MFNPNKTKTAVAVFIQWQKSFHFESIILVTKQIKLLFYYYRIYFITFFVHIAFKLRHLC